MNRGLLQAMVEAFVNRRIVWTVDATTGAVVPMPLDEYLALSETEAAELLGTFDGRAAEVLGRQIQSRS